LTDLRTGFWATARGKLISTLTIMFLVLGVMAELISLATSAYNLEKTRAEATIADVKARGASCDALHNRC
jgi:hypothetical protein